MSLTNRENPAFLPPYLASRPTPLHLYYENRLREDARALREGIHSVLPEAALFYSAKTNPLPALIACLLGEGWNIETVSPADRRAALEAGATGERLLLNGNAWTEEQLTEALFNQGVGRLTLDSSAMARLLGKVLRSRPSPPPLEIAFRVHDGQSHFGFPAHSDPLGAAFRELPESAIKSIGLHIHSNPPGSIRRLESLAEDFQERSRKTLRAAECLNQVSLAKKISFVDLGGGLDSPWVYRPSPAELGDFHNPEKAESFRVSAHRDFDLREIGKTAAEAVHKVLGDRGWKISFEPGRAVCTRALSTLVEVKAVKSGLYPDGEIVITDGNTAILGPLHRGLHPVSALGAAGPNQRTFVYGNLPHSGDWLFQSVPLPKLKTGDRLLISHTGAYFLALEANFGLPRPGIYDSGRELTLRAPETI